MIFRPLAILIAISLEFSSSMGQGSVSSSPDTATARRFLEQGSALLKDARYDSAITLLEKAEKIFASANRTTDRVRCLNTEAECLIGKSSLDKAADAMRLGREVEETLLKDSPLVAAQRYVIVGSIYRKQGKSDSALVSASSAERIRREMGVVSADLEWDICTLYASAYLDLGEHDSSLAYNNRALRIFSSPGKEERLKISNTYSSMATMYEARGDYRKALEYFSRTLEILRTVIGEKHPDIGRCYNNIAAAHMRLGDYDLSLEYYFKSMSIFTETLESDHPSFGIGYNNIAMVYRSRGEFDKAIEAGEKSKAILAKKLGAKHPNVAGVTNNIGRTYSDMGKYDRALESFKEALGIWEERLGQKHPNVLQSCFNIGEAYGKLGKPDEAIPWLQRSLDTRRQTLGEKNAKVAQSYSGLGAVYAAKGLPDSALYFHQKAIDALVQDSGGQIGIFRSPSDLDLLSALSGKAGALCSRFRITRNVNDLKLSLATYEQATELVEEVRRGFGAEGSKIQLAKTAFEVYEGGVRVASMLHDLTHDDSYTASAFSFAERSKAGVLADAIGDSRAKHFSGIPDSLLEQEYALRVRLAFDDTQLQKEREKKGEADKAKLARLESSHFDTHQKYAAFVDNFERRYPAYHALRLRSRLVTLGELQKQLPDNRSAILEYFVGDSSVTIFAVTRQRCTIRSVATHGHFAELVGGFRRAITSLDDPAYAEHGFRLFGVLISPVAKELKGVTKLTIIPDGILHYLPFEALLTKSVGRSSQSDFSGFPYLIREYEVDYQLSARLLLEREKSADHSGLFAGWAPVFADAPPPAHSLLGAAMVQGRAGSADKRSVSRSIMVEGEKFAELKESENEVRSIAGLFQALHQPARVFINRAASEAELKSDETGSYRFIHIATHGIINEEQPKLSGIIFAAADSASGEDGILDPGEVYNLRLNADLVVLSACQTGLGTIAKGEGILGFTRGFMYAGARNLVVSLWQVADKSTADLMVQFYKNILKGQSYSTALRNAKLAMIKGKKYAHPVEWSPFVLNGN